MWTRPDYENAAEAIGKTFVSDNGTTSINDLSLKVAQDEGLNPHGIRTLVRLANVAAWEHNFEKRSTENSEDRMVEFDVGDPEIVISKLQDCAKEAHSTEKTAAVYSRTNDYYGDITYPKDPLEKTALAVPCMEFGTPFKKGPSKAEVSLLFKKAEAKMREEQGAAQYRWVSSLEKAGKLLVATDSRITARTTFEKNAASLLGEDILPELRMVHKLTSPSNDDLTLFGGEKLSTILDSHISVVSKDQQPIIKLLKEANESRKLSHLKAAGLKWLEDNRTRVIK